MLQPSTLQVPQRVGAPGGPTLQEGRKQTGHQGPRCHWRCLQSRLGSRGWGRQTPPTAGCQPPCPSSSPWSSRPIADGDILLWLHATHGSQLNYARRQTIPCRRAHAAGSRISAPLWQAALWHWAAIWRWWLQKHLQLKMRMTAADRQARAVLRPVPGGQMQVLPARRIPVAHRKVPQSWVLT